MLGYLLKHKKNSLRVFDGNCDTGIKGIRMLKSFGSFIKHITMCDRLDGISDLIKANFSINNVEPSSKSQSYESTLQVTSYG